ncbi:hypothetical protein [Crocosphaera sp. Alani8]|uniref:hypothetical protein n=1 Tax=Crocosphaera sp. Alani8 TaxID=3038952 RepID=UPI00313D30A1
MFKNLLYVLAFIIPLGVQQGMVYGEDNSSHIIIAQTPATSPSPTPSPTTSPATSPSPTPSPSPQNQTTPPPNEMNIIPIILVIQGFVFLVFKGFEVFNNKKKISDATEVIIEHIKKSLLPPDIEKLLSLPDKVQGLNETVETLGNNLNNSQPVPTDAPNAQVLNSFSQQLENRLENTIQQTLRSEITGQIDNRIDLHLTNNDEFINKIAQAVTNDHEFINKIGQAVVIGLRLSEDNNNLSEEENQNYLIGSGNTIEGELPQTTSPENRGNENSDDTDEDLDEDDPILTPEEQEVVTNYNNRSDLQHRKTQARSTEGTNVEARTGREYSATLSQGTGIYWIIQGTQGTYLVPNYSKTFNSHQMESVQIFFECKGYVHEQTDPNQFTLEKPAKVTVMSSGEIWTLSPNGKGTLRFSG